VNPERWQRIKSILEHAVALSADNRDSYVEEACNGDPELHDEVSSLLRSHDQAGSVFLKNPAVDLKIAAAAAPALSRVGRRIGAYQIIEEIAHGGMGEVYRAVRADGEYDQQVAIKLVRTGFDTPEILERFRHERQILATLEHPNIARLLDAGTTDDGIPYLVMELIEGTPVDQYCEDKDLGVVERLQLFRQVCLAVQYAHQRLVIHRDIKPSNILVTADGVPKLLDFGIAKIFDPAAGTEATVLRPMTPEYASPEQVRGDPITTATDVYSLGVVLYKLLTGRTPYPEKTRTALEFAKAICEVEPVRPSTVA
jgi:eukaryotic-like serine/threonine-protein kinase